MPEIPIPVTLRHRPTVGGLVVPWITMQTPDGRHRFGAVDAERLLAALTERICQICGNAMSPPFVFAMRDVDLSRLISPEPAMHPECARYSVTACPMLAGTMTRYRTQPPDAHASTGDPAGVRSGHAAQVWRLLWTSGYRRIWDHRTHTPAAQILITQLHRVQQIKPPTAD